MTTTRRAGAQARLLVVDQDDTLAETIRGAVGPRPAAPAPLPSPWDTRPATAPPAPEPPAIAVQGCADLSQAAKVLAHDGPFDVLVAGPSTASASGLEKLRLLHDDAPGTAVVLAFPRTHRLGLPAIVRTGALDLVYVPDDRRGERDQVTKAVERALEVARRGRENRLRWDEAHAGTRRGPGTVFTIGSATGGCGKTFLAANLAYFFASMAGRKVCILDLDLQFGEVSTALRLRPRFTIADALQMDGEDGPGLAEHLEEFLVRHETGIWVLAAPKDPAEADRIEPPEVGRIIDAARERFDVVIVDTPTALTEVVLAAYDRSDVLYTVATLDTPSVRNLGVFLHTLERLKIPADNIRLVLNKAESDVGIEVSQVTRLFPQGFQAVLPYAKEVSRSINVGMPVVASAPGCEVSRLMLAGFAQLLEPDERDRVVGLSSPGRARRWWRFGR